MKKDIKPIDRELRLKLTGLISEAQTYFASKGVKNYISFIVHDHQKYNNDKGKMLVRKVMNGRVVESDEQVVNDIIDVVNRLKNS